jgi:hypothetical protein
MSCLQRYDCMSSFLVACIAFYKSYNSAISEAVKSKVGLLYTILYTVGMTCIG